jgi:hypothetical protein
LKDFSSPGSPNLASLSTRFAQITDIAVHSEVMKRRKFTRLNQWHPICLYIEQHFGEAVAKPKMMPMNTNSILDKERDLDLFESVTEEEIIYLWRSIKGRGISEDEAWHAVVTGLALDMAFAKTKACKQIEH